MKLFIGESPYIGFYQSRAQRNKYLSMKNNHIFFNPLLMSSSSSLNPRPLNQFPYKNSYNQAQQRNYGNYNNQHYNNYNQKYQKQQYSNQYQNNRHNYKKRPYEEKDYQPKPVKDENNGLQSQKHTQNPIVEVNHI